MIALCLNMTPILAVWVATLLSGGFGIGAFMYTMQNRHADRSAAEIDAALAAFEEEVEKQENKGKKTRHCKYCNTVIAISNRTGYCTECLQRISETRNTVTNFDAFMACPWCDYEDTHYLRPAHPQPTAPPDTTAPWGAWASADAQFHTGYLNYVRANADILIEAYGESMPVRVIMNDAASEAHARKIKPIGLGMALDSSRVSLYDHPDARTIRTCTQCSKEWAQK